MVGTNAKDFTIARDWSAQVVGPFSDGLVRINNAVLVDPPDTKGIFRLAPRAFVHRSHSGYFGIVNSEEGYQNLIRFLFGDVRADGRLEVDELTLPPAVQREKQAQKDVRASYLFEVSISVRGKPWQLHRRIASV